MVDAIVERNPERAAQVAREHFEATTLEPWRSVRIVSTRSQASDPVLCAGGKAR